MWIDKQFFHRATNVIAEADIRGYSINRFVNRRAIKKCKVCSNIVEGLDMQEEDTFRDRLLVLLNFINNPSGETDCTYKSQCQVKFAAVRTDFNSRHFRT